ncbi:unnamed protein product [Linum trigynum]|uniref:Uncharacterized protein n=1 Tax=Linum trigynum TaxID=586398 RepID=A0AAV2EDD7_9ROSI
MGKTRATSADDMENDPLVRVQETEGRLETLEGWVNQLAEQLKGMERKLNHKINGVANAVAEIQARMNENHARAEEKYAALMEMIGTLIAEKRAQPTQGTRSTTTSRNPRQRNSHTSLPRRSLRNLSPIATRL